MPSGIDIANQINNQVAQNAQAATPAVPSEFQKTVDFRDNMLKGMEASATSAAAPPAGPNVIPPAGSGPTWDEFGEGMQRYGQGVGAGALGLVDTTTSAATLGHGTNLEAPYTKWVNPQNRFPAWYGVGQATPAAALFATKFTPSGLIAQSAMAGGLSAAEEIKRQAYAHEPINIGKIGGQALTSGVLSLGIGKGIDIAAKITGRVANRLIPARGIPKIGNVTGAEVPKIEGQVAKIAEEAKPPSPPEVIPPEEIPPTSSIKAPTVAAGSFRFRKPEDTLLGYARYEEATPMGDFLKSIPDAQQREQARIGFLEVREIGKRKKEAEKAAIAWANRATELANVNKLKHKGAVIEKMTELHNAPPAEKAIANLRANLATKQGVKKEVTDLPAFKTLSEREPYFNIEAETDALKAAEKAAIAEDDRKVLTEEEKAIRQRHIPFFQQLLTEHQKRQGTQFARIFVKHEGEAVETTFKPLTVELTGKFSVVFKKIKEIIEEKAPKVSKTETSVSTPRMTRERKKEIRNRLNLNAAIAAALGAWAAGLPSNAYDGNGEQEKNEGPPVWQVVAGLIATAWIIKEGKAAPELRGQFTKDLLKSPVAFAKAVIRMTEDHMMLAQDLIQGTKEGITKAAKTTFINQETGKLYALEHPRPFAAYIQAIGEITQHLIDSKTQRPAVLQEAFRKVGLNNTKLEHLFDNPQEYGFETPITEAETRALHGMVEARDELADVLSDSLEIMKKNHPDQAVTIDALDFAHKAVTQRLGGVRPTDKVASVLDKGYENAMRFFFYKNPFHHAVNLGDPYIVGTLYTGPKAVVRASSLYNKNKEIKGLLQFIHPAGGFQQEMERFFPQEATKEGGKVIKAPEDWQSDLHNGRKMILAGLLKYADENAAVLSKFGYNNDVDFVKAVLSGSADTNLGVAALGQAMNDVSHTTGFNFFQLHGGIFGRSPIRRYFFTFIQQPERFAHGLAKASARAIFERKPEALLASLLVLHQLGGTAVIPQLWQQLGWNLDPNQTAYLLHMMRKYSLVQQTVGDASQKLGYDPTTYPLQAATSPQVEMMRDIYGEFDRYIALLKNSWGATTNAYAKAGRMETKEDYQLYKGLRTLLNAVSTLALPIVKDLPTAPLMKGVVGIPAGMANKYEMFYPSFTFGKPIKPSKLMTEGELPFNTKEALIRDIVRLPQATSKSIYQQMEFQKSKTQHGKLRAGQKPKPLYKPVYNEAELMQIKKERGGLFPDWPADLSGFARNPAEFLLK